MAQWCQWAVMFQDLQAVRAVGSLQDMFGGTACSINASGAQCAWLAVLSAGTSHGGCVQLS